MIEHVLAEARERIVRLSPSEAAAAGELIVDTRSTDQRERDGIVPGSVHVPLSVLEWRADQTSGYANPALAGRRLILLCAEGYSSSLAAARLSALGIEAGDVVGGFEAWSAAGLPVAAASNSLLLVGEGLPGMGGPE